MRFKISISLKRAIVVLSLTAFVLLIFLINFQREKFTGTSGTGYKVGVSLAISDLVILSLLILFAGALIIKFITGRRT